MRVIGAATAVATTPARGRSISFVHEWYRDVYAPRYRQLHARNWHEDRRDRRDDWRHDRRDDRRDERRDDHDRYDHNDRDDHRNYRD